MPRPAAADEGLVGLNFPYLEAGEPVRARARPDFRLVVGETIQSVLGALLLALVLIVIPFYASREEDVSSARAFTLYLITVVVPEAVFILQRFGKALVEVLFAEYVVTDHRVYAATAFLKRTVQVVPFEKITNLVLRRTLFERLLGVAEVRVVAYGQRGTEIRMRGLRDAGGLFARLAVDLRAHGTADSLLALD